MRLHGSARCGLSRSWVMRSAGAAKRPPAALPLGYFADEDIAAGFFTPSLWNRQEIIRPRWL
jgi:hypothetical protein